MKANKLNLSQDKAKVLLVNDKGTCEPSSQPVMEGTALLLKEQVHSLGLQLDPGLQLESQVSSMARGAFCQLHLLMLTMDLLLVTVTFDAIV